ADHGLAAGRRDEALLEECVQDRGRVDPADLLDLGQRDRLPVGDHGQGLQSRQREAASLGDLVKLAQQRVELRPRDVTPASRDLLETHAALGNVRLAAEDREGLFDGLGRGFEDVGELLFLDRPGRAEEQRLEGGQDLAGPGLPRPALFGGKGCGRRLDGHQRYVSRIWSAEKAASVRRAWICPNGAGWNTVTTPSRMSSRQARNEVTASAR